jgi:hypothetical protein
MSRNDVLWVGAAGSVLLFSGAWLTGYWDNRIPAWIALLSTIAISSGVAWYTRDKKTSYQKIATNAGMYGAIIYIGAAVLGLIATRWAHGSWSPELNNATSGVLAELFNRFPADYMKTILRPSLTTLISGAALLAIWSALGSSFLPSPEQKKSVSKKRRK